MKFKFKSPSKKGLDSTYYEGGRTFKSATRFNSAEELRSLARRFFNQIDEKKNARILEKFGNKPFVADGEKQAGFGYLNGQIQTAKTRFTDSIVQRKTWAIVATHHSDNDSDNERHGEAITAAFHKECVRHWKDSFIDLSVAVQDMLLFTRGHLLFNNVFSCYPEYVAFDRVGFELSQGPHFHVIDALVISDRISAVNLFNKAHREDKPWNLSVVKAVLSSLNHSSRKGDDVYDQFAAGCAPAAMTEQMIDLFHCYVVEYSEEKEKKIINKYVILRNPAQTGRKTVDGFLSQSTDDAGCIQDVIGIVACDVSAKFSGLISMAESLYAACNVYDKVINRVLQATIDNMRLFLKTQNPGAAAKLRQMRFGNIQFVDPSTSFVQERITAPINEAVQVVRTLIVDTNTNTSSHTTSETEAGKTPKSAAQARIDYDYTSKASSSQLKVFNCWLSIIMETMFKRWVTLGEQKLLEECEQRRYDRFCRRLKNAKIPSSAWTQLEDVTVSSAALDGWETPEARIQKLGVVREALSAPAASKGEMAAKRGIVAAAVGEERVSEFIQDTESPIPEDSLIGFENDSLGRPFVRPENVPVMNDQLHFRHIPSHLASAEASLNIAAKMMQGLGSMPKAFLPVYIHTTNELVMSVDNLLSHTQAHLALASKSRSQADAMKIKQYAQKISELNAAQDKMARDLQSMEAQFQSDQSTETEMSIELKHKAALYDMEEQHKAAMIAFDQQKEEAKHLQHQAIVASNADLDQRIKVLEATIKARIDASKPRQQQTPPPKK